MDEIPSLTEKDFATFRSDLYVVASEEVIKIVKKHNIPFSIFAGQTGSGWNGAGQVCLELMFQNQKFWDRAVEESMAMSH